MVGTLLYSFRQMTFTSTTLRNIINRIRHLLLGCIRVFLMTRLAFLKRIDCSRRLVLSTRVLKETLVGRTRIPTRSLLIYAIATRR